MVRLKCQFCKHLSSRRWLIILSVIICLLILLRLTYPFLTNMFNKLVKGQKLIFAVLKADTSSLATNNNRVNLLFLGIAGGDHEGKNLTDTMIFISIDKNNADTVMLSIPRDIWLDSLKAKVNTAYYYGEEEKTNGGFALAKDSVSEILGQPLNYTVLLDFDGFIEVINLLGGLNINVDRSFDDYKYPISGKENDLCNGDPEYQCRYEHLHFEKGLQYFDGETALKFVRSRNAEGEEGTDFSRSQRQQKVILAIKNKIFSYKILLNPQKIIELKNALGNNIKSDTQFSEDQITAFLSLLIKFVTNKNQIRTISLETGDEDNPGFLYNPPIYQYNQWVLIPQNNDWQEIHKYIKDKIEKEY